MFYQPEEVESVEESGIGHGDKFADLFEDAKKRKERQDKIYSVCLDQECTFQPDIGINRYKGPQRSGDKESFVHRLAQSNRSRERSLAEVNKRNDENFDPKTGQPFFKPKTGRPPLKHRNTAHMQIGDYLYSQQRTIQENLERKKVREEEKLNEQMSRSKVVQRTNKIMERTKHEKFEEVF